MTEVTRIIKMNKIDQNLFWFFYNCNFNSWYNYKTYFDSFYSNNLSFIHNNGIKINFNSIIILTFIIIHLKLVLIPF